jgi:hypothetical protein
MLGTQVTIANRVVEKCIAKVETTAYKGVKVSFVVRR